MSEAPNRQAVIVGLFISLGIVFLAGGILTVGSLNDTFSRKIRVSAVFDEVNGLQAGNNIWFSGMKVGVVKHLGFQEGSQQVEIEMAIDREASEHIPSDAVVKISSDGLIGNKIVVIYDGTPSGPLIEDGDELDVGAAVSTEDMIAMFQHNNENLLAITTDLKGLTAKFAAGEGSIGKLLTDDALYEDVTTTVASLQEASANAETLTASLATFTRELNRDGNLANDLVTDKETYASLTASVQSLEQVIARASGLVDGLEKGANDPNSAIGTLMHDPEAGADLKAVLENLNKSTVLLGEDLEAAQHNMLLRGYFKKKEKAEETPDE